MPLTDKKLGIAKRDLKAGEEFQVRMGADGLLHSEAINCMEGITLNDFLETECIDED